MAKDSRELLELLQENAGFEHPELWIDYARRHGFERVRALQILVCPDCASEPGADYGQYVYYSSLIRLRECTGCGLIWADAQVDPGIVRRHFEAAYKDDVYFRDHRREIFAHLSSVIDAVAPLGARVLDIGGARGDLMHSAAVRRPDLHVTVQDISTAATDYATTHFGFATLCGNARSLASHAGRYDVAVLSDVLYYEPDLATLWSALDHLISPGGAIVIRVPNHFLLTRVGQRWYEMAHGRKQRLQQDRVVCHNPEHIFIFRQSYLRRRLRSIGFTQVRAISSPLLSNRIPSLARSALFNMSRAVNSLSRGTVALTPSILLVGSGKGRAGRRVSDR